MAIQTINEFTALKVQEKPNKTPHLILENSHLKKNLDVLGTILEAQYRIGSDYLLLVTEGNPFEEALYIYFLNENLHLKDRLELSAVYSEGSLRNVSITDVNTIQFSFFDSHDQWILNVLSTPKHCFFENNYPIKRYVPAYRKSWLRLKKRPNRA